MNYKLTVWSGDEILFTDDFDDFEQAINATGSFYTPKNLRHRSVLSFTTEVINGKFFRSYASLVKILIEGPLGI